MKKIFFYLIIIHLIFPILANDLSIVENPTAAVLQKGEVRISQKIYKSNSMIIGCEVGLFEIFQFGMAYGAEQVVGDEDLKPHNLPAFKAKLQLLEETFSIPAIALGIDTQGHGKYYKKLKSFGDDDSLRKNRFETKSKGAYAVASKNFILWGLIGIDLGSNYSFEGTSKEDRLDFFTGLYKTVGEKVTLYSDFSCGFNDTNINKPQNDPLRTRNRGFLNCALQFQASEQFAIKLMLNDLFRNRKYSNGFDRSILIDYHWFF